MIYTYFTRRAIYNVFWKEECEKVSQISDTLKKLFDEENAYYTWILHIGHEAIVNKFKKEKPPIIIGMTNHILFFLIDLIRENTTPKMMANVNWIGKKIYWGSICDAAMFFALTV